MMYFLRYAPEAVRDMDNVWDGVYEVSKSFDVANKYVDEFAETIEKKKQNPFSGVPLLYRGLFTGFYSVNYKKYKAFYRINGAYVEVLRIIMAKRDYMTVLFGEVDDHSDRSKA